MHTIRFVSKAIIILIVTFSIFGFSPLPSPGSIITVNTFEDQNSSGPTQCSLREAITAANTNAAYGGCPAGSGVDTIVIPAGTYNLSLTVYPDEDDANAGGDLDINSSLNLVGAGMHQTIIDASGSNRVISVNGAYTVSISDLRIRNGSATSGDVGNGMGGGLANYLGSVTLTRVMLSENHTQYGYHCGGIANGGNMVIVNSWVTVNYAGDTYENPTYNGTVGGGICNLASSTLSIDYTTIDYNHAGHRLEAIATAQSVVGGTGGGIYNEGTLTIDHSLIANNFAGSISGFLVSTPPYGVFGGWGGGIYNLGSLTISNTTLTGNHAGDATAPIEYSSVGGSGGALATEAGTVALVNVTLYGNYSGSGITEDGDSGGIVLSDGTITVHNTILMMNEFVNVFCYGGSIISQDYNIWDHIPNCMISGPTAHNLAVDPLLSALANHWGPTQTLALLPGSPAIDAGDPARCPVTDQRGFYRPLDGDAVPGARCDIGAYEYGYIQSFVPLILRLP